MSEAATIASLKVIFRFPFQGPNWRSRFIVGIALIFAGFLVPIVPGIFVYGYLLRVMGRALKGESVDLPAWEDWGRLAIDGLRGMVINLVYLLPAMIVFFGGMALYFTSSVFFPLLMGTAEEAGEVALGAPFLLLASMAIMFLSMFIGSVLFVAGAIPLPVATAHFVVQDKLSAAFDMREWWPLLQVNKLGYFIAWVVGTGLMGIWYFVSMIPYYTLVLCCLIPFLAAPIGFYVSLVSAVLFGQTYRESAAILASREPVTLE